RFAAWRSRSPRAASRHASDLRVLRRTWLPADDGPGFRSGGRDPRQRRRRHPQSCTVDAPIQRRCRRDRTLGPPFREIVPHCRRASQGVQHVGSTYRSYGHGEPVDIWSVLVVPREDRPGLRYSHFFNVVARLRPDVTWAAMEEDLRRTGQSVARRYPVSPSPWRSRAVPLKDEIVGTAESTLMALGGAATAVLILACINVAGLLLGRGVG